MIREKILQFCNPHLRLPVVGIDFSDRTFKYLKFKILGANVEVDYFGEVGIPEGVIVDGEIKQEDELARVLTAWRTKERRPQGDFVVASLPEEKSFLKVLQLPRVERDAVGQAIRWEVEGNIPLTPEEIIYDYEIIEPIHNHLDHFDVVMVAFPRVLVESYVRVLKRVGLQPVALELESQAIVRAVIDDLKSPNTKIIVDLGRNRTSLIVFSGSAIIFTTTLPVGGKIFEDNITRALGVSPEKAMMIKKDTGFDRYQYGEKLFLALAPAISVLRDELQQVIRYYRSHAEHTHGAGDAISEIILTGGDANLLGLATFLAGSLKVPVRAANPFSVISSADFVPLVPKNQSLAFTTTIGLALRGIRNT